MTNSSRRAAWLPQLGWLLLCSLICLSAALYNGFPLVTSDSGAYINSAIHQEVPSDRPITYGLFMLVTSLRFSYWFIIWAQSLLLAALLLRCVVEFVPWLRSWPLRLALVGVVAWATGFSWYCSQLMPDIFTAIGLLALGLLVLGRFRSGLEQGLLLVLLLLSAIMHSSNLLSFSIAALGFGVAAWQQRLFARQLLRRAHWLAATAVVLAGWVLLPALHAAFGGGFTITRAAPIFLMGRLVEAGVVDAYLADHCGDPDATWLCAYRDRLPNDAVGFLWGQDSPYQITGGLEANLAGYRRIVRVILTSPRYYPRLAAMAVQSTLRQLTHIAHGDGLWAYRENSSPYWRIPDLASYEMKPYLSSLQNHNTLHFEDLNARAYAAQLLALLVVLGGVAAKRRGQWAAGRVPVLLLLALWGLGLVANAFAAGALANVLDRLQGRVAWLLPFGAVLLLAEQGPMLAAWVRTRLPARNRLPAPASRHD
ncbi:hypothetical protein [Hymenobacter psoromatis]|uniref:hypothetical protein n=1 Tax=Hymenobacter psoromatis TaxID=1484116 RepID=UPI001CBEFEB4|nr:hypothetical protein [Hymenobacter psoromatis]